jgi:hypothetical protein
MTHQKTVAIIQSNYIPWKGYFDIIHDVDLFIFLDDVQYTVRDWRNRNKIKTSQGSVWLSIPVGNRVDLMIYEVEIKDPTWAAKHWDMISQWYRKAPYFKHFSPFFEEIYLRQEWKNLSVLNQFMIQKISQELLGIKTEFADSRTYNSPYTKAERIIDLARKVNANRYLSGPSAKDYLQDETFIEANIELVYKDYSGYPEYPQFHPPFDPYVSILDLLFHTGDEAPSFIWGWREGLKPEGAKETLSAL